MDNPINHLRHGDVLMTRVDSLPKGSDIEHKGQYILKWGEATNHAHRLTVKNQNNMKVYQAADGVYICLMEIGTLTHEEHKQLEVPVGIYKIDQETEYDPFLSSIRVVID